MKKAGPRETGFLVTFTGLYTSSLNQTKHHGDDCNN